MERTRVLLGKVLSEDYQNGRAERANVVDKPAIHRVRHRLYRLLRQHAFGWEPSYHIPQW